MLFTFHTLYHIKLVIDDCNFTVNHPKAVFNIKKHKSKKMLNGNNGIFIFGMCIQCSVYLKSEAYLDVSRLARTIGTKVKTKMKNYVCQVPEFAKTNIHIKNQEIVNQKIKNLIDGGFSKLQVVSDFDKTITKQHKDGEIHMSSFGMFSACPSVTEEHTRVSNELHEKYAPSEVDPTIPKEEKIRLMVEWWSLSEDTLKGLCVCPEEIQEVCAKLGPSLRDGTKELFDQLHKLDVPVLVFSAGLGDTVVAVLKHCDVYLPNVEVVSNFLKYDTEGKITGFQNNMIHVYNKNEGAIKGTEFYKRIENKENVILMGDSLGDAAMVDGMDTIQTVLKIGFLYERSEEALPDYMDTFDIVLVDDQTMSIPRSLLELIKNSRTSLGDGKA